MRIRSKLSFLAGSILLNAVLVSGLSVWATNVTTRLRDTIDSGNELLNTALTLHGLMKDLMFDLFTPQTYRLLKDLLYTPRFQTTRRELGASVEEFERSIADFMQSPGVRGLLRGQELRDAYDTAGVMIDKASERIASFQVTVDRLFAAGGAGGTDLYRELQTGEDASIPEFFSELRETSYYLTYSFESFLTHFIRSLEQEGALRQRQVLILSWSVSAAVGLLTLCFTLLFARNISRRISTVEGGVRAIARGDFGARLEIRTSDEFGTLAEHFNGFMVELKRNVDSIQTLMRDIGGSLAARSDHQSILELIAEAAVRDSHADGAAVLVAEAGRGLVVSSRSGAFPLPLRTVLAEEGGAADGGQIRLGSVVSRAEPLFLEEGGLLGGHEVGSLQALPLATSQGTLGLLCVVTLSGSALLTDLDYTNFRTFAEYASLILDNYSTYRELLGKREADYRALQSQIQPHFLYNVLNGLIGLNRMGDRDAVESTVFSLKDMLRYILDEGSWTTIGKELEFLRRYCDLQKLRFQERLEVEVRCDAAAAATRIPKLLLQPVVENAVIHGIEPLDRAGHLEVEARMVDGGLVRITVSDDGVGFPTGTGDGEEGIGLANVRGRLLIAYPSARLTIARGEGGGTRVLIDIPEAGRHGEDTHSR